MYDVIIIGSGPAGISAGIYLKRANIKVLILTTNSGALSYAKNIENYYGFESISGKDLYEIGMKQAKRLGIEIKKEEVVSIKNTSDIEVITDRKNYKTKTLVLATGTSRGKLNIKNIEKFYGNGVSTCAVCDGFFYKNRKIGVLGNGKYAIYEIEYLKNLTKDITIFTNGEEYNSKLNNYDFPLYETNVKEILGKEKLDSILLKDGKKISLDGIFIAYGSAGAIDFAKELGILTYNNNIKVNEKYETNIEGIYAVGDAVNELKQISVAVSDGAKASKHIIEYIKGEKDDKENK